LKNKKVLVCFFCWLSDASHPPEEKTLTQIKSEKVSLLQSEAFIFCRGTSIDPTKVRQQVETIGYRL